MGMKLTGQSINSFLSPLNCGYDKFAYFRAIRAFVNWLIRNDYIKDNPLKRVDPPDLPPEKVSMYNVSLKGHALAPICIPTIVRLLQVFNL